MQKQEVRVCVVSLCLVINLEKITYLNFLSIKIDNKIRFKIKFKYLIFVDNKSKFQPLHSNDIIIDIFPFE